MNGIAVPVWAEALFVAGFVVVVVGCVLAATSRDRRQERRVYWYGWTLTGALLAAGASFRGWQISAIVFCLAMLIVVVRAYFRTPYIKIGGRIYALLDADSRPDPDEGDTPAPRATTAAEAYAVSPTKRYWLLVTMIATVGVAVLLAGWAAPTIGAAAFLAVAMLIYGAGDAAAGAPVFRGQYVQAVLALLMSIPAWGLPIIAYGLGYLAARSRRAGHQMPAVPVGTPTAHPPATAD